MKTLTVALGERSYPIHIGAGLLSDASLLAPFSSGRQILIVSNETVAPLYLDRLHDALPAREVRTHILPDGEQYKTLEHLGTILDTLVEAAFSRDCLIVALGGGVVGDIAGFAGACFQRGVDVLQVPTTLLSLVDSSVGGKTAVNHPLGKNLIGAFHQPVAVIADTDTLGTLPDREYHAGLGEVTKYGLINDPAFFAWLENNANALMAREPDALTETIYRSCENKARLVAEDERETGARALLNLGHTFGHAIEAGTGYGTWLHGEAVAAGTLLAADLSRREGWLDEASVMRIRHLFRQFGLPIEAPSELGAQQMLELMARDKKVLKGELRLILLDAIGAARVTADYSPERLRATLDRAPG